MYVKRLKLFVDSDYHGWFNVFSNPTWQFTPSYIALMYGNFFIVMRYPRVLSRLFFLIGDAQCRTLR